MTKINNYFQDVLTNSSLQKITGGKKLPTTIGPADNPYMTDVHNDNDNDGVWSVGDSLKIKKLREIE